MEQQDNSSLNFEGRPAQSDQAMSQLTEMVRDHLGIPRAGTSKHMQELQDELLPAFLETARLAWMTAATPAPKSVPNNAIHNALTDATEVRPSDIAKLNYVLEELGVHDLLDDLAASRYAVMLDKLPLDSYEARLLKAAGDPNAESSPREFLTRAAQVPECLASPDKTLEKAQKASLAAHSNLSVVVNISPIVPATPKTKPKRRKMLSGLGKMFSGLVLVTGNAIVIPTVTINSIMALPVLASIAAGIAAVGEGGDLILGDDD